VPRTIDHILATHQLAASLRKEGKPIWNKTIDIGSIIREKRDASPEQIADVGQRIAKKLRSGLPANLLDETSDDYDEDIATPIEICENYTAGELANDRERGLDILADLNGQIEAIYDWADKHRIWLG